MDLNKPTGVTSLNYHDDNNIYLIKQEPFKDAVQYDTPNNMSVKTI